MNTTVKPTGEFLKGCAETIVLSLLAERPMYGYELVAEIQSRSRGIVDMAQGTVYPLLYSLERKGLVEGIWETPQAGGRERKYYRLTERGRRVAAEDVSAWVSLVKGMNLILGGAR